MTDKQVIVGAGIPPTMAAAILAAQLDMPSLKKEDRNNFAKYFFVSIDSYYEKVPPIAAKHGLFWQAHELSFELSPDGKNIAVTYGFDLYYKDGTCLPNYSKVTVIHPIQGAQTAGSALSYAEKLLMRTMFKVVTGEEDADATDNTKPVVETVRPRPVATRPVANLVSGSDGMPPMSHAEAVERGLIPKPSPTGDSAPVQPMGEIIGGIAAGGVKVTEKDGVPVVAAADKPDGWSVVAEVFKTFVPQCNTDDDLKSFWATNIGALDKMKEQDEDTYKTVKAAFTARKAAITKAAKEKTNASE